MEQAVEQAYRDEWSRLLALLVTRLRRFDVAEDSLQDAFVALIAAEHAKPPPTDWPRVAHLYAELERRTDSPAVRLNRAVAVAESGSPEAALALLEGLDRRLPGNHLLPATRAEMFVRLGRPEDARSAFELALSLARTDPERTHLRRRLSALPAGPL